MGYGTRLICLLAALGATPLCAGEITVFAAASLKTVLDEIAADYTAESGTQVTLSFAGSSALARHIEQGAPADLFISANSAWMDVLEREGRIVAEARVDLLGNHLALIGPVGQAPIALGPQSDLAARLGDGPLAMALVEAVPAGIYGKAALTHLGLWDDLAPRVAQTDNVRMALALVALGEAPLGITYASDARAEPRVQVLALFPEDSHSPITYPAAPIKGGREAEATAFLTYLKSASARAVFEAGGFLPLVEGP